MSSFLILEISIKVSYNNNEYNGEYMREVRITKDDKVNYHYTKNGANKYFWMKMGCLIDIFGTLGISLLIIYSGYVRNGLVFYLLLYLLLVFIVIGAELIGTYYGSLEQYVLNKKEKKMISNLE